MTDHKHTGIGAPETVDADEGAGIDVASVAADLFEAVVDAQIGLFCARTSRDWRLLEQHRASLRSNALLLACLPVHPDSRVSEWKVVAATALRDEDGSEASHAWRMAEYALELDRRRHPPEPIRD